MRILIDLTHPAHVHFFTPAIGRLRAAGHEVKLVGRDKDVLVDLARAHGLDVEVFGAAPSGIVGLAATLLRRQVRLAAIARRFRPHVMAAIGGTFIGMVGFALRIPVVVFSDTESATLSNAITYPFVTRLCTPAAYTRPDRRGQVRFRGCHQSAYLDPRVFQPDRGVLRELGVAERERYCIVRFVGWRAGHDLGRSGLGVDAKIRLVETLTAEGRVFVSGEGALPAEFERHRFRLPVHRMHHAIAQATLVVGESSTMSAEAAVLGVPSVFIYPPVELGVTRELCERWGMVHWFTSAQMDAATATAVDLLKTADPERWRTRARDMAAAGDDVPAFVCEQILGFDPARQAAA